MAYGTVKVDNITFDQGGADQNVTASGIYRAITSGVTVSGTIAGAVLIGTTTVSGTTVTGTTANFASGVFTTQVSGATVTGTQSSFTSGNFVTLSGATATFTSGVIASGTAAAPSLSILGDANTGIYSPGADQVAVATNGTRRLDVNSSGQFRIGNGGTVGIFSAQAVANGNLHIRDIASVIGSGTGVALDVLNDAGSAVQDLAIRGANTIFRNSAGETLRITSAGLVGIGTSSPNYQLHVTTDFAVGASGFNQQLSFTNDTIQSLLLGTGYTALKLNPLGGNVGIGTTSPGSRLEVGGESAPRVGINSTGTGTAGVLFQGAGTTYGSIIENISTGELAIKAGASGQNSYFITFGTNDGTERARIDSSGRLLVGTSTARASANGVSAGLQVEGTGAEGALSIIRNGGLAYLTLGRSGGGSVGSNTVISNNDELGRISWAAADGTDIQSWAAQISAEIDGTPGSNDTPGRLVFSTTADGAASPTERMRITSAGSAQFAAATTGIVSGSVSGAGTTFTTFIGQHSTASGPGSGTNSFLVYTNGDVQNTNNSYGALSDLKLKENITDASLQWDDIKALQVRKYNFKEETGQQTHVQIGLVAQEVELVSPGLVTESPDRDEDGNDLGTVTKSVNYSVLYMKAVKALQEAMERIEALEAAVAALQSA